MTDTLPAFMALALRWKPAGEARTRVLVEAYCLIEVHDAHAARVRTVLGEGSLVPGSERRQRLCFVARSDARGVLRALPHGSASALDPLSLSALSPLLLPLGARLRVWWTHDAYIFDEVQRVQAAGAGGAQLPWQEAALVFDDRHALPAALEALLVELDDGLEVRRELSRTRNAAFPSQLLELDDDGRTWCITLQDHFLELAYDAAYRVKYVARLRETHHLPAHQLLIAQVQDIIRRRGRSADTAHDLIAQHQRLAGTEYIALESELTSVARGARREIAAAAQRVVQVYEQALHELSVHPYPRGTLSERGQGPLPRRHAAQAILEGAAVGLREQVEQKLYDTRAPGLEQRLLKIAQGEGDPAQADAVERLFANTTAVIAWLSKAKSYVQSGVKAASSATDPRIVEPLTTWLEPILLAASRKKQLGTQATIAAITRGMRMAQAWAGLEADFEFEMRRKDLVLQGTARPRDVALSIAPATRWNQRFERAGKLLKLLNVLSLADAMSKPDGAHPPVLKELTDLHGFIEGLEGSYRILTDTAETQLGVTLKGLSKLVGPIGLYLALDDAWSNLQTGSTLATQLAASSFALGVLGMALELAVAAPHPAVKLLLVGAGVVLAVATAYRYDHEEAFLEQYRPGCGHSGAYAEAKSAAKTMERALHEIRWENEQAAEMLQKLGS